MPADLYPLPFPALVARLARELEDPNGPLYSLPRRDLWTPADGLDLSMQHMAGPAGTPAGPASGPHTQMAQNIVLSYLAGARFMELKTVQILDELEIPRPCIFVPNIGYNVEWSQELRVPESAREYAAAWYLVHALRSDLGPGLWDGAAGEVIFDLSVGYDLAGIQSEKVDSFIHTMRDASALLDELRGEIKERFPTWAALDVPSQICSSTTLSTFHGCPADEIESIAAHTIEAHGLHTVIKLNPTLLGHDAVRAQLDAHGYEHVKLHREAFEKDLQWEQMMDMLPRLEKKAQQKGVSLGVKFSNTLVCESPDPPFGEGEMYLSGQPLHVLAMTLADKFRTATGGRFDISFSAGVDAMNFWKLASSGLKPITTCSDLLKGQGYARLPRYLRNLEGEMKKVGASTLDEFIAKHAESHAGATDDPAGASLARYAAEARDGDRYAFPSNKKAPKKIGSQLHLLDCITCDKCIKVCPNMANVTVPVEVGEWTPGRVSWKDGAMTRAEGEPLIAAQKHQIGNIVDLCNLCGQCDPWCPEDGGPYIEKPHLFHSRVAWADQESTPGFLLEEDGLSWRRDDGVFRWRVLQDGSARFETPAGALVLKDDEPVSCEGEGDVDLRLAVTMRLLFAGFTHPERELFVDV
jgi:putative selenate reductase